MPYWGLNPGPWPYQVSTLHWAISPTFSSVHFFKSCKGLVLIILKCLGQLFLEKIYLLMYFYVIFMHACMTEESIREKRKSDPTIDGGELPCGSWYLN